ncbi:Hypothetical predicted protein [Cloeon dipterum]|uniref:Uncharacterized protein n=1 Tax=Cloeon dipterum TaxID=197152 RepID=A0A8S1DPP2_9INSE|nr:Hypothetical predicted protein [Cloeon dipterum]
MEFNIYEDVILPERQRRQRQTWFWYFWPVLLILELIIKMICMAIFMWTFELVGNTVIAIYFKITDWWAYIASFL